MPEQQTLLEAMRTRRKLCPDSNKAKLVKEKIANFIVKCFSEPQNKLLNRHFSSESLQKHVSEFTAWKKTAALKVYG